MSFRILRDNRGTVPIGYALAFVTTADITTLKHAEIKFVKRYNIRSVFCINLI